MKRSMKFYLWGLAVCCLTGVISAWITDRFWYGTWEFAGGLLAGLLIQYSNGLKKEEA